MPKKLYIKTYGCQMNVYDSGRMQDALGAVGYAPSEAAAGADMVILNTCHIREKAAEKMYSDLGRIRREKLKKQKAGERMIIAVAGCVGQAEGEEIFARAPYVDIVVGPQTYQHLPDMVANITRQARGKELALEFEELEKFDALPQQRLSVGASAFLTIQEGCDKFCTFCVVPYTRGKEISRSVPDITREAMQLVGQGAREITLLGQNVNAYHGAGLDGNIFTMAQLIRHLARIKGLERIRYSTSHPRDMHEELYAVHEDEPKCMPSMHLPVQSGSDTILKAMNRKHTADDYRRIIDKIRAARPDIAISSDFIVGFPGETEQDFAETLRLVRDIGYAQAYSFTYSPRPGTPAAEKPDALPRAEKEARLKVLQTELRRQQTSFNTNTIGKIVSVLFEKEGRNAGQLIGKSEYTQSVHVNAPAKLLGHIAKARITSIKPNSLEGELV